MTLPITKLKGGLFPKYKLEKNYRFEFMHARKRVYFIIPAGFEYDGATGGSFLFWRKSIHESPYTLAHDWLYYNLGDVLAKYNDNMYFGRIKKPLADKIFLQGIRRDVNVQNWRAVIASAAFKTIGLLLWYRRKIFQRKKRWNN